MVTCAAALAGQSQQSKAASVYKAACETVSERLVVGCVCFMARKCTQAHGHFNPRKNTPCHPRTYFLIASAWPKLYWLPTGPAGWGAGSIFGDLRKKASTAPARSITPQVMNA